MLGLSSGTVYGSSGLQTGTARMTNKNTAKAVAGSKLLLHVGHRKFYLDVVDAVDCGGVPADLYNDIGISSAAGVDSATGSYRKISKIHYTLGKTLGTSKGKLTASYTLLSSLLAALATVAASQKDTCSGLHCVQWYTWCLIGTSVLLSLLAWYKDNAF